MIVDEATVEEGQMRTTTSPECYVCGATSKYLYSDLKDRLFGAPGVWNIRMCQNRGCELIWLDPMPTEEDIHIAYRDYYTHGAHSGETKPTMAGQIYRRMKEEYCAKHYGYERPSAHVLSRLCAYLLTLYPGRPAYADYEVMYLSARRGGKLLDVGCGSGVFLTRMAQLGWQVQGVDFDEVAVSRARKAGLSVFHGTLEGAPYPDECFDAITMAHVLEHVHRPLDVLKVVRRLLKRGGTVSIVTPNARSFAHHLYGRHSLLLDPPRHLHIFSLPSLVNLLRRAGFESVTTRTTSHAAHGVFVASRSIQRTGSYQMDLRLSVRDELWSRGMELAEWLILKLRPYVGEEIACVATK